MVGLFSGTLRDRIGSFFQMQAWWVYLVRCSDNTLYTGIAVDVAKRFCQHQEGGMRAAKYLRGRGPLLLAFKRRIGDKGLALKVEMQIKKLKKQEKEKLLTHNTMIDDIIQQVRRSA